LAARERRHRHQISNIPERDPRSRDFSSRNEWPARPKPLGELLALLTAEFGVYHYGRVDLVVFKARPKGKAIGIFRMAS